MPVHVLFLSYLRRPKGKKTDKYARFIFCSFWDDLFSIFSTFASGLSQLLLRRRQFNADLTGDQFFSGRF